MELKKTNLRRYTFERKDLWYFRAIIKFAGTTNETRKSKDIERLIFGRPKNAGLAP